MVALLACYLALSVMVRRLAGALFSTGKRCEGEEATPRKMILCFICFLSPLVLKQQARGETTNEAE